MPTWGRGGAGNIVSQEQVEESNRRIAEDLEANKPLTTSAAPPATTSTSASTQPQDYAHMGRGGAGNWYQPTELQKEGSFTQPLDSTTQPTSSKPEISKPWTPQGVELPVARSGRGGAGNFVWGDEGRKREEEEQRREEERERVKDKVVRDVESGLARPERVVLGVGKSLSGEQYMWS